LIEQGYDFRCADMPTKDRFMPHIYAAFAEEERRRISERTKAALQSAKARGKKLGSGPQIPLTVPAWLPTIVRKPSRRLRCYVRG
jgi:DNA invertase Pin-like site-specific DNA recombinase